MCGVRQLVREGGRRVAHQGHVIAELHGEAGGVDVTLIAAWCELRGDYRHFRADRIVQSEVLEERHAADGSPMMVEWMAKRSQNS
ncbi:WYL domain-containing protein [Ensifer sp. CCNWLY38]